MERPKMVQILIDWVDEDGITQHAQFDQDTLEDAEVLIGLMDGNITEEDLTP